MINRELDQRLQTFSFNILDLIKNYGGMVEGIKDEDYLQLNANFLYIFSLFERLVGDIIKASIKHNSVIKEKYLKLFSSLAESKIKDGNKERNWTVFFNQPDIMIEQYQIIEKEKNQIVLAKLLFNLDLKDPYIKELYKKFCEIRERRNLFIHRGEKPDQLYYDTLKEKFKIDKKIIEKINEATGLYSTYEKWDRTQNQFIIKQNRTKDPKNISSTPNYLVYTAFTLHSFIFIMVSKCWDFAEQDSPPLISMHDLLRFSYDFSYHEGMRDYWHVYTYYTLKTKHQMTIHEKVNLIIILQIAKDDKLIKSSDDKIIQILVDGINNEDETYENKNEIHQLMQAYINDDIDSFIKTTLELIEKDENHALVIDIWLMYRKFKDSKKFKKKVPYLKLKEELHLKLKEELQKKID